MKNKGRIYSLLAALLLLASFCLSCGQKSPQSGDIVLTDQIGRTVTLTAPAKRVVSGYYVTTYAMLALGQKALLCGVEAKAETRPIYQKCAQELLSLPAVGTMKSCDMELILSLSPDLVLLPAKLSDCASVFESVGVPVLFVSPESQEELEEMLSLIGRACGAESQADALCAYYHEKEKELRENAPADPVSVCLCGNSSFLTAAPDGMYQGSLIALAGGVNAAGALDGNYWTEISYESFLAMDPDAVILPVGASYTAEEFSADTQLSALSCVKNGRVYAMPGGYEEWDSPVPSGILGALWMRSVLYPELYPISDFEKEMTAFYETFYGFTPDTAE